LNVKTNVCVITGQADVLQTPGLGKETARSSVIKQVIIL